MIKAIMVIIFTTIGGNGGVAITTAEFATMAACEEAKRPVEKLAGMTTTVRATCVPAAGR